ncbi:aconitate hydratase AcnA [Sporosarcina koreensis]|uniref:Aconitate hydratase n=1 Tax=Sporosarcina koreensis TaxID=334735 RepID=A0ABW0U0D7_9BACL
MTSIKNVEATFELEGKTYAYACLGKLAECGFDGIDRLPYSIKALLESAIRQKDGTLVTEEHIRIMTDWKDSQFTDKEIPFIPARVILQDFTGVPAIVDLAAMRSAVEAEGGDISAINPRIPVDLVVDHSVIMDVTGSKDSFRENLRGEYERNEERYRFVKWAQQAFDRFNVIPPASGIVHQVNMEYLATGVRMEEKEGRTHVFLDTLVGTDSHTTMINSLGIVGWGVGGIEAEAAMLGQPIHLNVPQVVGVRLVGALREGVTATDCALTVTNLLRKHQVIGKIVEFTGPALDGIQLADRATIANMAPEYGATMAYFPADAITFDYLRSTGRSADAALAEAYYGLQGLLRTSDSPEPEFTEVLELDLSSIRPSLAGPKRPQDLVELGSLKKGFEEAIGLPVESYGYGLPESELLKTVPLDENVELKTGSLVLAAITSCTNTSNPSVMVAAGLVAKRAVELGMKVPDFVKTSLTPGSTVVTEYLRRSGLLGQLEALGFFVDGYGCAVCCGNTGPLDPAVENAVKDHDLIVSSVLSGNRNFEGRVHPLIKANYLASPPLVIAFALAGSVRVDLTSEPIGKDSAGNAVYLKDLWPSSAEIEEIVSSVLNEGLFTEQYRDIHEHEAWNAISSTTGRLFEWDEASSYIRESPFFGTAGLKQGDHLKPMRALLYLGDSITTDHISPVGSIGVSTPAGRYLKEQGVAPRDFNSYGSRRGNHHVMVRGTFANVRLRNRLAEGKEGGFTKFLPTGDIMPIYDAAIEYGKLNTALLVIAGKEYGTGSSRDWAAKGTALLGVKVVLAESFERIHRSNLVGMGVLPLQFLNGQGAGHFGLTGREEYRLTGDPSSWKPGQLIDITIFGEDGKKFTIQAIVRLDSEVELHYFRNGGILPAVMKSFLEMSSTSEVRPAR